MKDQIERRPRKKIIFFRLDHIMQQSYSIYCRSCPLESILDFWWAISHCLANKNCHLCWVLFCALQTDQNKDRLVRTELAANLRKSVLDYHMHYVELSTEWSATIIPVQNCSESYPLSFKYGFPELQLFAFASNL